VLQEAQKEFPAETEIVKLLEVARHDEGEREKAEKHKQDQLGEARKLIGARQYEGALGTLDQLLQQWPTDAAAKELRGVAQQGRQEQIREQQLREDLASLKKMVDEGRYPEAIAKGEKLRQGFPHDVYIPKLVAEAKSGQARFERKQQLDQWNEKIGIEIKNGRFRDAIKAADAALKEFPKDSSLAALLERAKTRQVEKEKREVLDKRIKEIRTKISRDDLEGAVKLAVQTLESVGPDAEIGQLLQSAKLEIEQREQKKRDQQETLQSARSLVRARNLEEAAKIVDRSLQTGVFSGSDPRLAEIRRDIEKRQARLKAEEQKQARAKKERQPEKIAESKVQEERTSTFSVDNATIIVRPPAANPIAADRSQPSPEVEHPAVSEDITPAHVEESPRAFWKNRIAISTLAVVAIGGIVSLIYYVRVRRPPPPTETAFELKVEHDLMNDADQLMAGNPHRFADSLAKYQQLVEKHESLEAEARRKVQEIQDLQRQENGWMDKGKAAQASNKYDEALTDYGKAKDVKGDREQDAEDAIAAVNDLIHGNSLAEVAKKDFKQADDYMAQKQWRRAASLYRQVKETKDAPPALRSAAAEKEAIASAHLTEEALFSQANSVRPIDPKGAKVLYQRVVDMKGDHQQEAAKKIQEIDAEIAKGDLLRLSNQTRILIDKGDAQSLQEAKQKYQEFLDSGGQDTTDLAARIRDREKQVQDAAERGKKIQQEQEERARFDKAVADFEAARVRKDTGALNGSIKDEFQKLVAGRGAHADQAKDYVDNLIPATLKPPPPPPPPPPSPALDDRALIAGVLDRFKDAYNHKSMREMKSVWLGIPKAKLSQLDLTFKNASIEYSLKYDKASFQLNGDSTSATAVADFTVRTAQLSEKKNRSGKIVFSLTKQNNQWFIVNFQ